MIQKFLQTYKEAFGNAVPLPVTFGYSHIPVTEINKIPRCMIGTIRKVCEGDSLTLSADNVLCGGGSLYTAFAPMQERLPKFVSETEHYKQTPEQIKKYIHRLDIHLTDKPYLNFVRMKWKVFCFSPHLIYFRACVHGLFMTTMQMMLYVHGSHLDVVAL